MWMWIAMIERKKKKLEMYVEERNDKENHFKSEMDGNKTIAIETKWQ